MNIPIEKYTLNGKITGLYLGEDPISFVTQRKQQVTVNFAGLEGDKHAGITLLSGGRTPRYPRGTEIRNDRQVSIVSVEDLETIAGLMNVPEIKPEWLGANLLIEGIPGLGKLPPSTRIYFAGGVTLTITAENHPCAGPGKVIGDHFGNPGLETQFTRVAMHKRGVVAMVEKPGILTDDEDFQIIIIE